MASIHVRRGRPPCLPEMGGRKGRPYNMRAPHDARAPKGEHKGRPYNPQHRFGHPWERRTPVRPRNPWRSIHVRTGQVCLPEMGGRKGPYNMRAGRPRSQWANTRAAPTMAHGGLATPGSAHAVGNPRAISHKSLQDKVWSVVLLGLISCNGYIGARESSVL